MTLPTTTATTATATAAVISNTHQSEKRGDTRPMDGTSLNPGASDAHHSDITEPSSTPTPAPSSTLRERFTEAAIEEALRASLRHKLQVLYSGDDQ